MHIMLYYKAKERYIIIYICKNVKCYTNTGIFETYLYYSFKRLINEHKKRKYRIYYVSGEKYL